MNKKNLLSISLALTLASTQMAPLLAAPDASTKKDPATDQAAGSSISGSVNNGKGAVIYNGKEVWKGRIDGKLTAAGESICAAGEDEARHYAAAWDDDELIWENYPGAGEQLKKTLGLDLDPKKKNKASRQNK